MSGIPFQNTVMGQRLIEGTLPDIARELRALNSNMSRIADTFERAPWARQTRVDSDDIPDAAYLRHVKHRNEGREL